MKIRALQGIKHKGRLYFRDDIFDADKETAGSLVLAGAAVAVVKERIEYDGAELFENAEDLSALKVDELRAICKYLGISDHGRKDELIAAIESVSEEVEETGEDAG